jgi:hypothetical protein
MQMVPVSKLEGYYLEHKHTDPNTSYIPHCPQLDVQVKALHLMARHGAISADTAERQINSYLLAPHARSDPPLPGRYLLLPLTDAPHHDLLPDLGQIVHQILTRAPIACSLSAVIEQCIPRFRHTTRTIHYTDSQAPLLTLAMGLLLGLYHGPVKKPCFSTRATLLARLHRLMTSKPETQTEFCRENEELLLLAGMEYLARVLPVHMPVQNKTLTEGDAATSGFYRRIPPLCDELRQGLDEGGDLSWEAIRRGCAAKVERVSRLKRCHPHAAPQKEGRQDLQTMHPPPLPSQMAGYWGVPVLHGGTTDEYSLLAMAQGLHGPAIQYIQQTLQVFPLPRNLRQMQLDRLSSAGRARAAYLQTRHHICMQCTLTHKTQHPPPTRLRLDTLQQRLVCANCLTPDPVCVNMLGRLMLYRKTYYYLCPCCSTVHPYEGKGEQPWVTGGCTHAKSTTHTSEQGKRKEQCTVCSEQATPHTARRVDQLTGDIHLFHFCQRHTPRLEAARKCVNAKQMAQVSYPTRTPR